MPVLLPLRGQGETGPSAALSLPGRCRYKLCPIIPSVQAWRVDGATCKEVGRKREALGGGCSVSQDQGARASRPQQAPRAPFSTMDRTSGVRLSGRVVRPAGSGTAGDLRLVQGQPLGGHQGQGALRSRLSPLLRLLPRPHPCSPQGLVHRPGTCWSWRSRTQRPPVSPGRRWHATPPLGPSRISSNLPRRRQEARRTRSCHARCRGSLRPGCEPGLGPKAQLSQTGRGNTSLQPGGQALQKPPRLRAGRVPGPESPMRGRARPGLTAHVREGGGPCWGWAGREGPSRGRPRSPRPGSAAGRWEAPLPSSRPCSSGWRGFRVLAQRRIPGQRRETRRGARPRRSSGARGRGVMRCRPRRGPHSQAPPRPPNDATVAQLWGNLSPVSPDWLPASRATSGATAHSLGERVP